MLLTIEDLNKKKKIEKQKNKINKSGISSKKKFYKIKLFVQNQ